MQHSGDYIPVLNALRSRIQTFNAQLDTYKEKPVDSLLTTGVSHADKTRIQHCQQKTSSMDFVASVNEFSFHWEMMTRDQHIKYLADYVETEYGAMEDKRRESIKAFLVQEVVNKKSGYKHVTWNGYFIERLPELHILENANDNANDNECTIKFKAAQTSDTTKQTTKKTNANASFGVMRAQIEREKKDFFA